MARITVKVHPRAKRTRVAGKIGDAWKLDLAAPPADGKANAACVRFFAELAGVPQSRVRIVIGLTSRTKVVEIDGASQEAVERRLVGQA
ncbi:MAG: DUF167 domain-containing protein [Bryobacteraceae bacterium]|jgi:uncharacterized protein (TIGR00251 family)